MQVVYMDTNTAAKAFKELGHPSRLNIVRYLVIAGDTGAPVGDVQETLGIPNSTLSHHLSALMAAGLITQRREGRILYCVLQFGTLRGLAEFMLSECCRGKPPSSAFQ